MKKILIVGAGNIGIGLAIMLGKKHDVLCIGGEKLRQTITGSYQKVTIITKNYDDVELKYDYSKPKSVSLYDSKESYFDYVFITSKIQNTLFLINSLEQYHIKYGQLSVIQNGLMPDTYFRDVQGIGIISVYEGFKIDTGRGILYHRSSGQGWTSSNSEVAQLLSESGIRISVDPLNVGRTIKLLYNVTANAFSALENKTLGELFENNDLRNILLQLFTETYGVLIKLQSNLGRLSELWKSLEELCLGALRDHYSSTHEDFMKNKTTEIDFLNGLIVKFGEEYTIKTPISKYIYNCIKKYVVYKRSDIPINN